MAMKPNGMSIVSTGKSPVVMYFRDISQGPHESELWFRLIHFWEARNIMQAKTLIGLEMRIIDEQGTAMQGFIPASRVNQYLRDLKPGTIYRLFNFFRSKSKEVYRVADHSVTISFSYKSVMSVLTDNPLPIINEDRFRFHSHKEFEANCDLKGDLYDVVGHMKLVDGQTPNEHPILDEVEISTTRRVMVHLQPYELQRTFAKKIKVYENTPTVLLVTTVNTKDAGGTFALSSMSSSRKLVNAEVVTKAETMTIGEINTYIKQATAKVAHFECIATIDDVVRDSAWYYIACSGCQTKAIKGPTSLMCSKCGNFNVTGVAQYHANISVYDNNEQAVFHLLGVAGRALTGKPAAELVDSYFEANQSIEADQQMPIPEALINTIGQTHKFSVKVTDHNLTGKTQTITVTKILSPAILPPGTASVGNPIAPTSEVALLSPNDVCAAPKSCGDVAGEGNKSTCHSEEPKKAKRPKHGN
ncbi:hypothetical protein Bca101_082533 [Brassica carinata]